MLTDNVKLWLVIGASFLVGLALGFSIDIRGMRSEPYNKGFQDGISRSITAAMATNVKSVDFARELLEVADSVMNPYYEIGFTGPGSPKAPEGARRVIYKGQERWNDTTKRTR